GGQGGGVLGRRRALPRQGRLIDLQGTGRDDATIRRYLIPGGDEHDIADNQLLGRDLRLLPSRRTLAVAFIIDLSAFMALSALPSWRKPTTAFSSVNTNSRIPVLHSLINNDTTAALTRMSCM